MGLDMYIYNARKESELNFDEDWKLMEDFYRGITAKHPERYNLSN